MAPRPPGPGDSGRFFNVENVPAKSLDKLLYATEREGHKLIAIVATRDTKTPATRIDPTPAGSDYTNPETGPASLPAKAVYSYTLIFERVKAAATVE
jgi:hypothetical protein